MSCRQLCSETEFCCAQKGNKADKKDTVAGAKGHDREQQERNDVSAMKDPVHKFGTLERLLPAHVDDIEGIARTSVAEDLFSFLNTLVGRCNADCGSFCVSALPGGRPRSPNPRWYARLSRNCGLALCTTGAPASVERLGDADVTMFIYKSKWHHRWLSSRCCCFVAFLVVGQVRIDQGSSRTVAKSTRG